MPFQEGTFTAKVPVPIDSFKGRLLSVTASSEKQGGSNYLVSRTPFKISGRAMVDSQTGSGSLVCLFPQGPLATIGTKSRERYRGRVIESDPGLAHELPIDQTLFATGFIVIRPEMFNETKIGGGWKAHGRLCPQTLSPEPVSPKIVVRSISPNCGVTMVAELQDSSFLDPFGNRIHLVRESLEDMNCRPGDMFEVIVYGKRFQCGLALLRLRDPTETEVEARFIDNRLIRFLHHNVCTHSVLMPPPASLNFNWVQIMFLSSVYFGLASLASLQILGIKRAMSICQSVRRYVNTTGRASTAAQIRERVLELVEDEDTEHRMRRASRPPAPRL